MKINDNKKKKQKNKYPTCGNSDKLGYAEKQSRS